MKAKEIVEKVLWQWKIVEYLAYLIIFSSPLYFINNNSLFSFNSPKAIFITGVVLLMTIFYFWGLTKRKSFSFKLNLLHILCIIFLFILTLSSILGVDPINSFFGRWVESINLILLYIVTIFAFFIGFLVKRDKLFVSKILLISFISSICVAIISFIDFPFFRGSTTLGNNSYAGAYLLLNICFGAGLFFYYSKIWQRVSIAIGILTIILSPVIFNKDILMGKIGLSEIVQNPFLLFGLSNAADVGLCVAFFAILFFFLIYSSKRIVKIIGIILLFSFILGIFFTGLKLVNPTSSIHKIYVETKEENRLIAWDIAKISFYNHPLLGSGFNNFSYEYQRYFLPEILKEKYPEFYFHQPHNFVLEYASNTGILGLSSFLVILLFTFLSFFKSEKDEVKKERILKIFFIGSLFGYFIQNLFGFDTPVTYLILFLIIGIAIGIDKEEWIIKIKDKNISWIKSASIIVIISSLIALVIFVILPTKEFRSWSKLVSTNTVKGRIELRNKMQGISLLGGVYDSSFVGEKFYDFYRKDINNINESNKKLYLEEIDNIVDQIAKDIEKQPLEIRAYLTSARLLNMKIFINGKVDEDTWNQSYDYIKRAIFLNPANPEIYLLLAQTYVLKNDFNNAYLSIRQAISIAPQYIDSYDYAKKILKIKPDINFQKYIDNMQKLAFN